MSGKKLLIPFALAGLGIVFAAVSVVLVLTKSNDRVLRKKLRIGALILTLGGFASTGVVHATCYAPEQPRDGDQDGLLDALEQSLFQTNPELIDSDGDGISDAEEDHDGDGISNADEEVDMLDLAIAADEGDVEAVAALVRKGTDLSIAHPDFSRTPLGLAAGSGSREAVRILLEAGADADGSVDAYVTPLARAAAGGHLEIVRDLLDAGALVDGTIQSGNATPLRYAAAAGETMVAQELLQAGADLGLAGNRAAVAGALYGRHSETAEFLIQSGADVQTGDGAIAPPIFLAVGDADEMLVRLLIDSGSALNARATYWVRYNDPLSKQFQLTNPGTPFLVATLRDDASMMDLLARAGADIDGVYADGHTALTLAASTGKPDAVRYLIGAGAELSTRTIENETALDLARKEGHADIVEMLVNVGATD